MATRIMHARRRGTPKGRGGSSGVANPRNDGRITEEQHDDAMRVLRAEYYQGVRGIAETVREHIAEGMDEGDALHQAVDGSYWVIYTHANFQVLMCSDHHDAYSEDYGQAPVEGDTINWAALAYATLARDVNDQVAAESSDLEETRRRPRRSVEEARRPGAVQSLPVIFRAEKSGDHRGEVTAVFPTLPGTGPNDFTVYAHVGQHSTGTHDWYAQTRAATSTEYASLLAELQSIYERGPDAVELRVVQRFTHDYDNARRRTR